MLDPQSYQSYRELFRGREEVLRRRSGGVITGEEMTPARLAEQAAGGESYGIYLRRADGTVAITMYDIDVADSRLPSTALWRELAALKPVVRCLRETALAAGITAEQMLLEFSGVGFHLWFFPERPLPAGEAALFLQRLQERAGYGYLEQKPRVEEPPPGSLGESVWLPLRQNTNSGLPSIFLKDLDGFDHTGCTPLAGLDLLGRVQRLPPATLHRIAGISQEGEDA